MVMRSGILMGAVLRAAKDGLAMGDAGAVEEELPAAQEASEASCSGRGRCALDLTFGWPVGTVIRERVNRAQVYERCIKRQAASSKCTRKPYGN